MRRATRDHELRVRLLSRRPLLYRDGADSALDRPAHVRAASGVVVVGETLLVVQDDALFVAVVGSGGVDALTLPSPDGVRQFDERRGNKPAKPDLESACRWRADGTEALLGFGSGSLPTRERILVLPLVDRRPGEPRLVDVPALYALLRELLPDAELNVEGAWRTAEGHLRLLQRGNGRGGVDAVVEVDGSFVDALLAGRVETPVARSSVRWALGALDGVRLTFTDGVAAEGGRWLFAAAAEDSPDAVADGPVTGSVVGWADDEGGRWAPVVDLEDRPVPLKLEGIAPAGPGELWGVVDADDPDRPSELLRLGLEGSWPSLSA